MREIKFRAWDKEEKRIFIPDAINFKEKIIYEVTEIGTRRYSFLRIELIEYTGLKDKNGKEIYEGDILEDIDRIGIIEFYQGGFIVQDIRPLPDESATYYHIDILGEDAEIIGNIYENSELMS